MHVCVDVELLRGAGAPAAKSVLFAFPSVQPAPARKSAVVFVRTGAEAAPSKQLAAPYPMKSTTPVGQAPVRAVALATRATFPVVADIAMLPLTSGAGRSVVPPIPALSCTRR